LNSEILICILKFPDIFRRHGNLGNFHRVITKVGKLFHGSPHTVPADFLLQHHHLYSDLTFFHKDTSFLVVCGSILYNKYKGRNQRKILQKMRKRLLISGKEVTEWERK